MGRTIAIGHQNFEEIVTKDYFYIDKTSFIKEWWENGDAVTLITRPRRFGKTLTMSMTEQFFSVKYAGRGDLFEKLSIWQEETYQKLQGAYPVISLSFANIKESSYEKVRSRICQLLANVYSQNTFLKDSDVLSERDRAFFGRISENMDDTDATLALNQLSDFLYRYYGKKVIILLDEYDTPMQEAYVNGYWEELVGFTRSLFNATFKTNPCLERAIMTGITRVSKESLFSDLNHLEVVTTTSEKYMDTFGFTQQEVWDALEEYGLSGQKEVVKAWYDGFTFGIMRDIYNPWSIINYMDKRKLAPYWVNTSSNSLVGKLIREGSAEVKIVMEDLLVGKPLYTRLDEQVVFNQLHRKQSAIWSLLLASGYLKVEQFSINQESGRAEYALLLTNKEVHLMFEQMVEDWFAEYTPAYNDFVKALLLDDLDAMNQYMSRVVRDTFSYFDVGGDREDREPERFYHGFVLGLMVDLKGKYAITSNRESGFGRYDVILEPLRENDPAIILEFKVRNPRKEKDLNDTVKVALEQIDRLDYAAILEAKKIPPERIHKYGFAFEGKKVLIG